MQATETTISLNSDKKILSFAALAARREGMFIMGRNLPSQHLNNALILSLHILHYLGLADGNKGNNKVFLILVLIVPAPGPGFWTINTRINRSMVMIGIITIS
jgi:hypothetical protein